MLLLVYSNGSMERVHLGWRGRREHDGEGKQRRTLGRNYYECISRGNTDTCALQRSLEVSEGHHGSQTLFTSQGNCMKGRVLKNNSPTSSHLFPEHLLWSSLLTTLSLLVEVFSHQSMSPMSTGMTLACSPLCSAPGIVSVTWWGHSGIWSLGALLASCYLTCLAISYLQPCIWRPLPSHI